MQCEIGLKWWTWVRALSSSSVSMLTSRERAASSFPSVNSEEEKTFLKKDILSSFYFIFIVRVYFRWAISLMTTIFIWILITITFTSSIKNGWENITFRKFVRKCELMNFVTWKFLRISKKNIVQGIENYYLSFIFAKIITKVSRKCSEKLPTIFIIVCKKFSRKKKFDEKQNFC